MVKSKVLGLLLILFFALSCRNESKPTKEKKVIDDIRVLAALPLKPTFPEDNPYTESKAELGKLLFFDPILSGKKDVACATCHHPEFGFAESLELSIGVNGIGLGSKRMFQSENDIPILKRNSQSIINTAFNVHSLRHQMQLMRDLHFPFLRQPGLQFDHPKFLIDQPQLL